MKRGRRGFTLVELIVALVLSAFILVGIVGVATQMVRFQMEGQRKGEVSGWTLLSLAKMHKELEDASVLDFPSITNTTGDHISGCSNYTRVTDAPIDDSLPVTAFWYCVETGGLTPNRLLRYFATTNCPAGVCPAGACPMPAPSCGAGGFEVYAQDFRKRDGLTYFFRRASDVAGIEVNYTVGVATATDVSNQQMPSPVFLRVQTKISMNKSLSNAAD